jgi:hypothetical protein
MLEKILNDVDYFDNIRKEILSTSPYYPEYIKKVDNNVIYYGTFVRIFRNDKWYKIPVLEMYFIGENGFEPIALLEKFIKQVQDRKTTDVFIVRFDEDDPSKSILVENY